MLNIRRTMAGNISESFSLMQAVCKCDTNTFSNDTESDIRTRKKKLPPIGVFWDIENCQIPKGRSAIAVAQLIRDLFFNEYREAEFLVVCDVKKENSQIIQELHDAQVTLIHVASTYKNAADEKLRQALRRFADTYDAPAAVILISSDINFAADLSDLKHRKKLHVILIHKENATEALLLCATEHYNFTNLTHSLPLKDTKSVANVAMDVIVKNLPKGYDPVRLRNRLKQLSDNCGGRVVFVSLELGMAVVRFNNLDIALRAQQRMSGEDVYGHKINVSYPSTVKNWEKSNSPSRVPYRKIQKSDEYVSNELSPSPNFISKRNFLVTNTVLRNQKEYFSPKQDNYLKDEKTEDALGNNFPNLNIWRPRSIENTLYSWPPNVARSLSPLDLNIKDETETTKPLENIPLKTNTPVDLIVTNLDQILSVEDLKTLLLAKFREYATVLNISLNYQPANNLIAKVQVSNAEEALAIITKLNKKKIGRKRITIGHSETNKLHEQITSILQEIPGNQLPISKLREILNFRYKNAISNAELKRIKNVNIYKGQVCLKNVCDNTTGDEIWEEISLEKLLFDSLNSQTPFHSSSPGSSSTASLKLAERVLSPNPSKLPMPSEELLNKWKSSSSENSEKSESNRVTPEKRRRNRLAANFSIPMV